MASSRQWRHLALTAPALALVGCGAGWRAPEPPRQVPTVVAAPRPPSRPAPRPQREPEVPTPPAPGPEPAATPAAVVAQSNYPLPRVWEWTLADGVRVWFRRSAGDPGRLLVRARAPGGWRGMPGTGPATLDGPGGLRLHLLSNEAVVEGEGRADDAAGLAQLVAGVLAGRIPDVGALSPDVALDAALAGQRPGREARSGSLLARFGRPGSFQVLFSGDVAPDTFIAAVAPALGRIRAGFDVLGPAGDSLVQPAGGAQTIEIPDDGRGSRAIVGFRAGVGDAGAGRRPDQALAVLDVLAHALTAELEAGGMRPALRIDLDHDQATLAVEVPADDPAGTARRVVQMARSLEITEASVVRARGRAVDSHERAVGGPAGWLHWLEFLSTNTVDPRAAHHYARTIRAVPVDRVRALAAALIDPLHAGVVLVGSR